MYPELLTRFFDLPYPTHRNRFVRHRNLMRIHLRGTHPGDVLLNRHPAEDPEAFRWRIENYVPVTRPVILRAVQLLSRILEDSSFGYSVSPKLRTKMNERIFAGNDFFTFFRRQVLLFMIEDPNGRLVWLPSGKGMHDPSEEVLPLPVLVGSEHIHYEDKNLFIYQTSDNGFAALTPNDLYKITPVQESRGGFQTTVQYRLEHIYRHGLERLPVLELGGIPSPEGGYESFFSAFTAFGNEAIRQFSDWQSVMASSAFPIKEIKLSPCDAPGCTAGKTGNKTCTACNGEGYKLRIGPFSALVRPAVLPFTGEPVNDSEPMLRYITPPTEIIAYAQRAWETLLQKAEESLCLRYIYEAQSGTAKAHDKEELYTFLGHIGTAFYDGLILPSLQIAERYLHPFTDEYFSVRVRKPVHYGLKTGSERREEFTRLAASGIAPHMTRYALTAWAAAEYGNDPVILKINAFLVKYDPLITFDAAALNSSRLSDDELYFHHTAPAVLIRLAEEKGTDGFLNLTDEELLSYVGLPEST